MKRLLKSLLLALCCVLALPHSLAASQLRTLEADSFRSIAAQRGKPMVVMLWSLDCNYCEASFAALETIRRQHGAKIVTIATDRADDPQAAAQIRDKLSHSGLHSEAWAFGAATTEQLRYAIDPKWRGELPRTYWFDGKGGMRSHSGVVTAEQAASHLPGR